MKEIAHDVHAQGSIGTEEFGAKIEINDFRAVAELCQQRIGVVDFEAIRIGGQRLARKDGLEDDDGIGANLSVLADDLTDPVGDILRGTGVLHVIGADHQEDDLRVQALGLPVGEPPEEILGGIAGDAEIEWVIMGECGGPDLDAGSLPEIGDGIPVKDDVDAGALRRRPGGVGHCARFPLGVTRLRLRRRGFWRD